MRRSRPGPSQRFTDGDGEHWQGGGQSGDLQDRWPSLCDNSRRTGCGVGWTEAVGGTPPTLHEDARPAPPLPTQKGLGSHFLHTSRLLPARCPCQWAEEPLAAPTPLHLLVLCCCALGSSALKPSPRPGHFGVSRVRNPYSGQSFSHSLHL